MEERRLGRLSLELLFKLFDVKVEVENDLHRRARLAMLVVNISIGLELVAVTNDLQPALSKRPHEVIKAHVERNIRRKPPQVFILELHFHGLLL